MNIELKTMNKTHLLMMALGVIITSCKKKEDVKKNDCGSQPEITVINNSDYSTSMVAGTDEKGKSTHCEKDIDPFETVKLNKNSYEYCGETMYFFFGVKETLQPQFNLEPNGNHLLIINPDYTVTKKY